MQKIKSLQELKQLSKELPLTITVNYGMLGFAKMLWYFDYSDSWKVIELANGTTRYYTTTELILGTDIFKGILTKNVVVFKVV